MLLREFCNIFEGYKEAIIAFSNVADHQEVNNKINQFKTLVNKNQASGNERNIDYWTKQGWEKFSKFVDELSMTPTKTQLKQKKVTGKSINLIDNDNWFIVIPLDKNASCFHGKDSDWCTTKLNANHFESYFYKRDLILIYCLNKQSGNMWAIAAHESLDQTEIFTQNDRPINSNEFTAQTGLKADELRNLAFQHHKHTIKSSKKEYQTYHSYLQQHLPTITQRDQKIERMLEYTKDGVSCRMYIDNLVANDQDVESLPDSIIRATVGYSPDYLEYFPNANEAIQTDAVISGARALKYINNPSDKILDIALTNHSDALRYIKDENTISNAVYKYPKAAAYQAVYVYKERLTGLEDIIATDATAASTYLRVMKEPWPEAEPAILKNEVAIPIYVKDNLKGKIWKEGEKALLQIGDPYYMYEYAVATNSRFEEAEPKIVKDVQTAAAYAVDVLHHRWDEIEDELMDINPSESDAAKEYAERFDWDEYMNHWYKYFPDYQNNDMENDFY